MVRSPRGIRGTQRRSAPAHRPLKAGTRPPLKMVERQSQSTQWKEALFIHLHKTLRSPVPPSQLLSVLQPAVTIRIPVPPSQLLSVLQPAVRIIRRKNYNFPAHQASPLENRTVDEARSSAEDLLGAFSRCWVDEPTRAAVGE